MDTHHFILGQRPRQIRGLLLLLGLAGTVWILTNWILTGSAELLITGSIAITLAIIALAALNNWRVGVLLFIPWLLFEDLSRKYLGNEIGRAHV